LTGGLLSLGSMVGFVTLFGITLRNSMLMISHYEHLVVFEGRAWGLETAIQGAADRLIPILMTSLVTGLGLLPLALGVLSKMYPPGLRCLLTVRLAFFARFKNSEKNTNGSKYSAMTRTRPLGPGRGVAEKGRWPSAAAAASPIWTSI